MKKISVFICALVLGLLQFSCVSSSQNGEDSDSRYLYVGTYTGEGSDGIYRYTYNHETGAMSDRILVAPMSNPSYLTISGDLLFAVSEEKEGARMVSYAIDEEGLLDSISSVSISGAHPCYVEYCPDFDLVIAANYTSGSMSVFSVNKAGQIDPKEKQIHQQGSGPNFDRQEGPHTHSVVSAPDGKILYSANLGSDKLYLYNMRRKMLLVSEVEVAPGSGPRHLAFHPNQKIMALANELSNTVTLFEKNKRGEYVTETQTISTLPDDFSDFSKAADIHFSNDGKFLYASNRGHNSIVCYSFDEETNQLQLIGWISTGGETPRNFIIDGQFLIVANQDSDNIVVFRIEENGMLDLVQVEDGISKPVCIKAY